MATMTQSDTLAQKVYAVRAKRHPGLQTWDKLPEHARDHWRDLTTTVRTVVIEEIAPTMRRLIMVAKVLRQNSEACAVQHYGIDIAIDGLPGWLADCGKDIAAADAALTNGGAL